MSRHVCKWDRPWRGFRSCKYCGKRQTNHGGDWAPVMTPNQFANSWLPMLSGPNPHKVMQIDVAAPFEWNCYESWNIVYRVKFDFSELRSRTETLADIMDGWQSQWRETFNALDKDARAYYAEQTGRDYRIGDNTYAEMRAVIQH